MDLLTNVFVFHVMENCIDLIGGGRNLALHPRWNLFTVFKEIAQLLCCVGNLHELGADHVELLAVMILIRILKLIVHIGVRHLFDGFHELFIRNWQ